MAKLTLTDVGSTLTNTAANTINENSDRIEAAIENTLSRDGTTPNQMNADIDLNSNDLLNVKTTFTDSLVLGGQVVTLSDLSALPPEVMTKTIYDPQGKNADAFARANHTGTQAISTVVGLQTELDDKVSLSETATQTIVGTLAAKYVLPTYRGLKISNFLTSDDPFTDQRTEVLAALAVLESNSKYTHLDLEGRFISISDQLLYNTDYTSTFDLPKKIINGTFSALNSGLWADDKAMLKVQRNGGVDRLEWFFLESVNFQCGGRASGFEISGDYHFVGMTDCIIRQPQTFGVRDDVNAAGGDLYLTRVVVERFDASTAFASRITTGFDIYSNDAKLVQCTALYCKHGLKLSGTSGAGGGSALIIGCHFYQGLSSGTNITGHNPAVVLRPQPDVKIVGCYIDNGFLLIDGSIQAAGSHGKIVVTDTIFTLANGTAAYNFIVDKPSNVNTKLFDWHIEGCTFRQFNGATVTAPFGVDTSLGGSIDTTNAERMCIRDNIWVGVTEQSTHYTVIFTMNGATTYAYNLTGKSPFALQFNSSRMGGVMRAGATPFYSVVERVTAFTGNLVFNAAVTSGNALVEFNANGTFNAP